ncbi:MAG: hypothetical protein SPK00_02430 [Corynebacterium glucuronolyticum]|nr:hypothetical protein [Corynebacterium glucuronolyticum]MDD7586938.1 hypothetical protein [Mycobacteriaceae bacterium]MDY5833596.1 hypothetical protein [Corynebacterium glucuronolyticum]
MSKPKQVPEADILALIGSLTNVARTVTTQDGIKYEVYEADRVDVSALRMLACIENAHLAGKTVVITFWPEYRDTITIPNYELPSVYKWVMLVLMVGAIVAAVLAVWLSRNPF